MSKRGNGEGTIDERGPGRYRLRWTDPPDPLTGVSRRRAVEFRGTKTDARRRLRELIADARPTADMTLRAAIETWRAQARHELATADRYDRAVRDLPAELLAAKIGDIRPATLRALIDATTAQHGPHRARLYHATISGALSYAVRLELLDRNPARLVSPPPQPDRESTAPTPAEVQAIMALVADDLQATAWLRLAATVGGRPTEVLALRWCDVDLTAGSVWVAAALDPNHRRKDTKNHQHRRVALAPTTVAALKAWRRAAIERAMATGTPLAVDSYVLSLEADSSRPWTRSYTTHRWIDLRREAGVRDTIRLYDLRHYMATTLLAAGVDVKTVSGRAGHRRHATTTDVYGAVIPANDQAAADILDRTLAPVPARRRAVIARRR